MPETPSTDRIALPTEGAKRVAVVAAASFLPPTTKIQNVEANQVAVFSATLQAAPQTNSRPVWKVRNHQQLKQRVRELGSSDFLVKNLLPKSSIGLLVGDSGLGKSPLLYQLSISIAAGIPFLNHHVQQGSVLYCDFENGLANTCGIVERQAAYLQLGRVPEN